MCVFMYKCVYKYTNKNIVEFLICANVNIMINKADKGQNTIELYIANQST